MTQNLIDFELSTEALAEIDAAIVRLESQLVLLRALDPEVRRNLIKMGDKSEAFCRQALVAFTQNQDVLPRNFDVAAYQRDLAALDALRPLRVRLERLLERMTDTETGLGSDLMAASLEGYAVLKVSGRGEGLQAMRRMLSARFSRGRRSSQDAAPDSTPEPVQ